MNSHEDLIREQFTKQAVPFSTAPGILDEEALALLADLAGVGSTDIVLDVACGPGIVACALATRAGRVTGIDITPAMIERAKELARQKRITNLDLEVGNVLPLPFADGSFTIVVSRYAAHHFTDPRGVLREMVRACAPGGRVVVADVAISSDPRKARAYNVMEKLRDPSHARALTLAEHLKHFEEAGLPGPRTAFYRLDTDVDGLLERSFPAPGGAEEVRRMIMDSLLDDGLGMNTRREGEKVLVSYPIAVLAARRPLPAE